MTTLAIMETKYLIAETFTENHCALAKDTVYRLKTTGNEYCPYYLQDLGDRYKVFTTKTIGEAYAREICTDSVTIKVFSTVDKAVSYLKEQIRIIDNNQPDLD